MTTFGKILVVIHLVLSVIFMAFAGAGAVTGALVVAWLGKFRHMGRTLLLIQIVFGLLIVTFASTRMLLINDILLFSAGFGLTFGPLNTAALVGIPEGTFGQVNAAFNTARHLAAALGTAAVVVIVGNGATPAAFDLAFGFLGANLLAGVAIIWFVYPHALARPGR